MCIADADQQGLSGTIPEAIDPSAASLLPAFSSPTGSDIIKRLRLAMRAEVRGQHAVEYDKLHSLRLSSRKVTYDILSTSSSTLSPVDLTVTPHSVDLPDEDEDLLYALDSPGDEVSPNNSISISSSSGLACNGTPDPD